MRNFKNYFGIAMSLLILSFAISCGDDDSTDPVDMTPTITSIEPGEGLVGDEVVITGTFLSDASVTFGSTAATVSANTETSITTSVPEGASTGKITVTTPEGSVESTDNFVVKLPNVEVLIEDFDGNGVLETINSASADPVIWWFTWSDPDSFNGGGSGGESTITTEAAGLGSNSTTHRLLVGEDSLPHGSGLAYVGSSFTSNEGDGSPVFFPDLGDITDFSKVKLVMDAYAGAGATDVTLDVEFIGADDDGQLFRYASFGVFQFSASENDWGTYEIFLSQLNLTTNDKYPSEVALDLSKVHKINFGTVLAEAGGTYKLAYDNIKLVIDPN